MRNFFSPHPSDSLLRRSIDEPLAMAQKERNHLETCDTCQAAVRQMKANSSFAASFFTQSDESVNVPVALSRVKAQLSPQSKLGLIVTSVRPAFKPALAGVGALALVAALSVTPLAASFISVFSPTHITPVTVSSKDARSLAPLADYGTVAWNPSPTLSAANDATSVAATSNLSPLAPGYLPEGVGSKVTYTAVSASTGTFTFSSAKAHAAHAKGKNIDAFDGASVTISSSGAMAGIYGDMQAIKASASDPNSTANPLTSQPILVIAKAHVPVVRTSKASISQFKDFLLSQPDLSPSTISAIKAIDSPTGNLPLPIPADQATSRVQTINGVEYTFVSANVGYVRGVMFIKGGVVYGVAGNLSEAELLKVAQNLS